MAEDGARAACIVIAHRGASGYRPEHSRSAYELAIALGADAIEPDVVLSRDGVCVLRHDAELSGTTDIAGRPEFADRRTARDIDGVRVEGWFSDDLDWAELATLHCVERLPGLRPASAAFDGADAVLRVEDLLGILDAAGRPVLLVAELKHAEHFAGRGLDLPAAFARAVDGRAHPDRLVTESFDSAALDRVAALGVPGRRVLLAEAHDAPRDAAALAAVAASGVHGVSVDKAVLLDDTSGGTGFVDAAHAAGLTAYTWTLRPENAFLSAPFRTGDTGYGDWRGEYAAIARTGVDAVFADHPDLAREALREH